MRGAASRRSHPVRVEDRLEIAQRAQERAQRLHVADLHDVPVLRHLVVHVTGVLDDVGAVLGERPRNVLQEARPVPRVHGNLNRKLCVAPPSHSTTVNRSGFLRSAFALGQSSRWMVIPLPSEM